MKRGSFHLPLAILLALGHIPSTLDAWSFSGNGDGTEISPYVITDVTQLQEMNLDLSAHYVLGNDIDASETEVWNGGSGFDPIGTFERPFEGMIDGQGFTITSLFIESIETSYVGLFGVSFDSTIRNVKLDRIRVNGEYGTGGLGGLSSATIENCHVVGSISGSSAVGGLIGWALHASISSCSAIGSIVGERSRVGGLVGQNSNHSVIRESSACCMVYGSDRTGGIVGENGWSIIRPDPEGSMIIRCYSAGIVTSTGTRSGGLVGKNGGGVILDSYSTAAIVGHSRVGGLVGENEDGDIKRSYSIGSVSGTENVGGFVGALEDGPWEDGTIESSYWDTQTSGQSTSASGTGKTSAEMYQQATFEDWDFETTWWIDEGNDYPRLRWEHGMAPDLLRMIVGFREGRETGKTFLDFVRHWKRDR